MKHLVKQLRPWLALAVVAVAALAMTTEAQAGHGCCVPKPTVTKCYVVQSPECCDLCTTVKVCLPACCADEEPCVTSRPTLLGYGQVKLSWSCGKTVVVRFTKHGARVL